MEAPVGGVENKVFNRDGLEAGQGVVVKLLSTLALVQHSALAPVEPDTQHSLKRQSCSKIFLAG